MGELISFNITAQEEIFIQYYLINGNIPESAFHAHLGDHKHTYETYDKVPPKIIDNLNRTGKYCLKKPAVKARISDLAKEAAEKNSCASLTEIMAYLTTVIRKSKQNEFRNIMLINAAIKAIETLIKRYPNFEGSADTKDQLKFVRGTS